MVCAIASGEPGNKIAASLDENLAMDFGEKDPEAAPQCS